MTQRVTVRVPATAANMGPGFDCLAMALDMWNSVEVETEVDQFAVDIRGEGSDELPRDRSNLVVQGLLRAFDEIGRKPPVHRVHCQNDIPLGRGLGSSAAAAIGGLVAGNTLCGSPLPSQRLLKLAVDIEGHPDNASAALLGGCQIVVSSGETLVCDRFPIPDGLLAVVFVPEVSMPTNHSRELLSPEVPRADAVYNMGRVAMLINAFSSGDLSQLVLATEDRLHQPVRQTVFPAMKNIIRAAYSCGALGAFLSGAGSSVLALTRDRELTIGYEMADAAAKSGIDGTLKITKPTALGAHVAAEA